MTTAWMLYALLVGGLLAAVAALVAPLLEQQGRATRLLWLAALLGVALLVITAPVRTLRRPAPTAAATPVAVSVPTPLPPAAAPTFAPLAVWRDAQASVLRWAGTRPPAVHRALAVLWVGSSVTVAVLFALVLLGMHRRRRRWPHAAVDGVPVRVTDGVGPLVVGITTPEVALPPWIVALPASARRLVLAHELEHQRARDPLLLLLGGLAVVVVPWHPAVWWLLRRLGTAIEVDCDARVLRTGVTAREYGMLLLDIASRSRPRSLLTPWPSLGVTSHLERRLLAMTTGPAGTSWTRRVGTGAIALAGLLTACESKLPTSAELEAMNGRALVERRVELLADGPATYTIDGREASKAEVEALPSGRIQEVEIRKGGAQGTVAVKTRAASAGGATGTVLEERQIDTVVTTGSGVAGTGGSMGAVIVRVDSTRGAAAAVREGRARVAIGRPPGTDSASAARSNQRFEGIVLIDGVERSAAEINTLTPDRIERVEVIKGPAARQRFPNNPRADQGAILIFTKGGESVVRW